MPISECSTTTPHQALPLSPPCLFQPHQGVLGPVGGMARSIKIEQLLLPNVSPSEHQRPRQITTSGKKPNALPVSRPDLVVNTSTSRMRAKESAATDRLSWELGKSELSAIRHRKRKSPIEGDVFAPTKPMRLPRFSVNIFNSAPVNAFPIPNEGCVPRMVKYYLQVWSEQHGRAFGFEGHSNPYQTLVFPYALQNGVLFEALVALSRASWLLTEGISWAQDAAFTCHRANAFAGLRLRLTSEKTCADDTTILTIAALTTIDYVLGIHEGAEHHVNAMQQIRKIRTDIRGNTPWHFFILSSMKAYESMWSFVKERNDAATSMSQLTIDSPLRNELPVYPSLPFSTKVCESLSKVSTVFNDMALAGELSIQMIDILAYLSKLARGDGSASPVSSPPGSPGSRNLLNTIADLRCLSVMATTSIEHLLCFGIVGCCFTLQFGDEKIGPEFDEALQALEDTLVGNTTKSRPQEDTNNNKVLKSHHECLIWVSVAAAGALAMSELFSAMTMVFDQLLEKYPDETAEWEPLEKILKKYLWNDLLARHWKRSWRNAMHRRAQAR